MSSEKKERSFVVDAIILCVITLILGAVLAGVNSVTQSKIAERQKETDNEACEKVLTGVNAMLKEQGASDDQKVAVADAESNAVEAANAFLAKHEIDQPLSSEVSEETGESYSKYVVVNTMKKIQFMGQDVGYVFVADARKGYGGSISFAVGVCQGVVTGIDITAQSETAGLGANCTSDEFKAKFDYAKGIQYPSSDELSMYYKAGTTPKDEHGQIEAMSGATVTSRAITNAVKGILLYDKELRGDK